MDVLMRPLLIALKPCYADLVFKGIKKVELRRRIVSQIKDHEVFIYVSNPSMELRGGFRVGEVWHGTPKDVWQMISHIEDVDKQVFDAYFEGQCTAYALEIKDVWEYKVPVGLSRLRNSFDNFVVPQSWRYLTTEERCAFPKMEKRTYESIPRI